MSIANSAPQPQPTSSNSIDLPIIDISAINHTVGKQILDAFTTHGFLYLTTRSTPFTPSFLSKAFTLSQHLFSLPLSTKHGFWIDTTNRGYTGIGNERLDPSTQKIGDAKEAWNWGELDERGELSQGVPEEVRKEGERVLKQWDQACREVCARVLEGLAMGLEIADEDGGEGKEWFVRRHGRPSGSVVRFLRYPGREARPKAGSGEEAVEVEEAIGAGAHSDYGSITLLFQRMGERGLEIRDEKGEWKGVDVVPKGYNLEANAGVPPIVVNVGDLLEYWTNGLLKSTVHRVVMPETAEKDRYSIVYFCHPRDDEGLVAVPSELVRERKEMNGNGTVGYGGGAEGKALTAKEHLMRRLEATYGSRKE